MQKLLPDVSPPNVSHGCKPWPWVFGEWMESEIVDGTGQAVGNDLYGHGKDRVTSVGGIRHTSRKADEVDSPMPQ